MYGRCSNHRTGVVGCSIARELSRYDLQIQVLERASDVCEGTSKANSGIVHAGFDAHPGTLKAKMNVAGNEKMEALSRELDFPFQRNGSLVLCFAEKDRDKLEKLLEQGCKRGEGASDNRKGRITANGAGYFQRGGGCAVCADGGIVCPFGLTIAMAEKRGGKRCGI